MQEKATTTLSKPKLETRKELQKRTKKAKQKKTQKTNTPNIQNKRNFHTLNKIRL